MSKSLELYNARYAAAVAALCPVADAEVLAILATDVDHSPAYNDGYEVQLDVDASSLSDSEFTHGAYNVEHTARWTTPQALCSAGTLHDDEALSEFVGPRQPALGPRYRARFSAAKLYASEAMARNSVDREAFPYLFKANGQRASLRSTQGYNAARKRIHG